MSEIVLGLKLIHQQNIIYRNLTLSNLVFDTEGHIRFVDFGYAKKFNDIHEDRTYTVYGNPGYMAPEILMGVGYNYKSDIWGLGVLI